MLCFTILNCIAFLVLATQNQGQDEARVIFSYHSFLGPPRLIMTSIGTMESEQGFVKEVSSVRGNRNEQAYYKFRRW